MVFLLCSSGSTLRFENGTAVTFLERRTVLGWPDTCCVSPLQVGNRSPERILAHQWARKYVQIRRPRRLDDMCLFPFIYPLAGDFCSLWNKNLRGPGGNATGTIALSQTDVELHFTLPYFSLFSHAFQDSNLKDKPHLSDKRRCSALVAYVPCPWRRNHQRSPTTLSLLC